MSGDAACYVGRLNYGATVTCTTYICFLDCLSMLFELLHEPLNTCVCNEVLS